MQNRNNLAGKKSTPSHQHHQQSLSSEGIMSSSSSLPRFSRKNPAIIANSSISLINNASNTIGQRSFNLNSNSFQQTQGGVTIPGNNNNNNNNGISYERNNSNSNNNLGGFVHSNRKLLGSTIPSSNNASLNYSSKNNNNYNNNSLNLNINDGLSSNLGFIPQAIQTNPFSIVSPLSLNSGKPLVFNQQNMWPITLQQDAAGLSSSQAILNSNTKQQSAILKMSELMEYLWSKGYIKDAWESFVEYVSQVEGVELNELLSDEMSGSSWEDTQAKEIAALYKLSMKFSGHFLSNPHTHSDILHRLFKVLQFAARIVLSWKGSRGNITQPQTILYSKYSCNLYQHLGVFSLRTHQYTLALNYFELALAGFNSKQNIPTPGDPASAATGRTTNITGINNTNSNNNNNNSTAVSTATVGIQGGINNINKSNNKNPNSNNNTNSLEEDIEFNFLSDDNNNNNNKDISSQQQQRQNDIDRQSSRQQIDQQPSQGIPSAGTSIKMNQSPQVAQYEGIMESVVLNNLAVMYGMVGELDRAEELLVRSVAQSESDMFQVIRSVQTQYLRKDTVFLSKLPVLIYGYLYCDAIRRHRINKNQQSLLILQQQQGGGDAQSINTNSNNNNTSNPHSFLKNAYQLSRKFLGVDNPLTLKVDVLRRRFACHAQLGDVLRSTFPFAIDEEQLKPLQVFIELKKAAAGQQVGGIQQQLFNNQNINNNFLNGSNNTWNMLGSSGFLSSLTPSKLSPNGGYKDENIGNNNDINNLKYNNNNNNSVNHRFSISDDAYLEDKLEGVTSPNSGGAKFVVRKGRNKSMHQMKSTGNAPTTTTTTATATKLPPPPEIITSENSNNNSNSSEGQQLQQQQFKQQQNGQQQQQSQQRQHQQQPSIEDDQSLKNEVFTLKQSLAQLQSQMKLMRETSKDNTAVNRNDNNSNNNNPDDLEKYKKDQQRQQFSSHSALKQDGKLNGDNESIPGQNKLSGNNKDINKQAGEIHPETTSMQQYQKLSKGQTSSGSAKDEWSISNGSIKPSQFKKESSKQQQQLLQQEQEETQQQLKQLTSQQAARNTINNTNNGQSKGSSGTSEQNNNNKLNVQLTEIQQSMAALVEFKDKFDKQLKDISSQHPSLLTIPLNANSNNKPNTNINEIQKSNNYPVNSSGNASQSQQPYLKQIYSAESTTKHPSNAISNSIPQTKTNSANNMTNNSSSSNNSTPKGIAQNTTDNQLKISFTNLANLSSRPNDNSPNKQALNGILSANTNGTSKDTITVNNTATFHNSVNHSSINNSNNSDLLAQQQQQLLRDVQKTQQSSRKSEPRVNNAQLLGTQNSNTLPGSTVSPSASPRQVRNVSPQPNQQSQQNMVSIQKICDLLNEGIGGQGELTLKRRVTIKDTAESYVIKFTIRQIKQGNNINTIQAVISSEFAGKEEQQIIAMSVFQELLRYVSYQDVLPSTSSLDSISSVIDICKYFILPFIGYEGVSSASAAPGRPIKLFPRAQGILNEYLKTSFLSSSVLVQVVSVEGTQLRLQICDCESAKKNLRVDIEYDDTSFNNLYTNTEKDEYNGKKLLDFTEATRESEVSQLGKELVHRDILQEGIERIARDQSNVSTNGFGNQQYFVQSLKINNYTAFTAHLQGLITELERIIMTCSIYGTLDMISAAAPIDHHLRFRVYQGLKKTMLVVVSDIKNNAFNINTNSTGIIPASTEAAASTSGNKTPNKTGSRLSKSSGFNQQPLQQDPANQIGVKIQLFNCFESYNPQGQKIKEKGEVTFLDREIKRMYGLDYESLPIENRLMVFALCSYNFNLRVIEKLSEATNIKSSGSSSNNNIIRQPTVSGGECASLVCGIDNYMYVVTSEVFGCKDTFLGVKITLYDSYNIQEQGVFLTTNHSSWIFQNEILQKKFLHFIVDALPLSQYFFTHIFKKVAAPLLAAKLNITNVRQMDESSNRYQFYNSSNGNNNQKNPSPKLLGPKGLINENCPVIRLEALMNPQTLAQFFMTQI